VKFGEARGTAGCPAQVVGGLAHSGRSCDGSMRGAHGMTGVPWPSRRHPGLLSRRSFRRERRVPCRGQRSSPGLKAPWRRVLDLARMGGGEGVLPLEFHGLRQIHMLPTPPRSVLALAAALRGADDPSARLRQGGFLGPVQSPLPRDPRAPRCSLLMREEESRGFFDAAASAFFGDLFRAVAEKEALGLDRFDLFHAHLLVLHDSGLLGALFHAREYPAGVDEGGHFPFDLGFCHRGSTCLRHVDSATAATSMARRNILWMLGEKSPNHHAFVLDTSPSGLACDLDGRRDAKSEKMGEVKGTSPAPRGLVRPYHLDSHTILESDLGECVADVYYFVHGGVRVCTRPQ